FNGNGLITLEVETVPICTVLEDKWNNPHTDQVRAMDTLERLRDDSPYPKKIRSLCSPVSRRAVAVFHTSKDYERNAFLPVRHRCIIDRHFFLGWIVNRIPTL